MTNRRPIPNTRSAAFRALPAPKLFYVLRELPCPYISGRRERKIITDLSASDAETVHGNLSRAGFRRSHMFAYRPGCNGCNACIPVRVDAAAHAPSKSQRRVNRRNADLHVAIRPPIATWEQFATFARYLESRHCDGEMASMDWEDYRQMVEETAVSTRIAEFRDISAQLIAVCLFDMLDDGTSAVYTFFEPSEADRSPGTYTVLWLIAETRRLSRPYVYLGYLVKESRKMAYKSRFKPLEQLTSRGWIQLTT